MAKKKSTKDQKKLEELKTNIEEQISKKKNVKIKPPKKKRKSKIRKKRARKVKEELVHEYVPKHSLLTEEEKEELSKEFDFEDLSNILISDPGIRHLEVKPGEVIRIKRTNPKVGDVYYYRIVVND